MSKTRRRPYYSKSKSKRNDKTCRNHGSNLWWRNNRTYSDRKRRKAADQEIAQYSEGEA